MALINSARVFVCKPGVFGVARDSRRTGGLRGHYHSRRTFPSNTPLAAMFIHDKSRETCEVTACQELAASRDTLSLISSDRWKELTAERHRA